LSYLCKAQTWLFAENKYFPPFSLVRLLCDMSNINIFIAKSFFLLPSPSLG
jgi:hypothetical protein